MPNIVSFVSLYHYHHVWCACRSQEEFTDSNVSCRVTSRPKHFLISLQIFFVIGLLLSLLLFILSLFVKCGRYTFLYQIYLYLLSFHIWRLFVKNWDFLRVVLEISWGRGLATLSRLLLISKWTIGTCATFVDLRLRYIILPPQRPVHTKNVN